MGQCDQTGRYSHAISCLLRLCLSACGERYEWRWRAQAIPMKLPRNFFKPLALGAPPPLRDLPIKLERMIHFVPPQVEKLRAKVPELVTQVDVVLGNLEDA